jgi:hypothetical protein
MADGGREKCEGKGKIIMRLARRMLILTEVKNSLTMKN